VGRKLDELYERMDVQEMKVVSTITPVTFLSDEPEDDDEDVDVRER
jgi:hypothetical protein